MSRIGKIPVKIPDAVTVTVSEGTVTAKGPKGQISSTVHNNIAVTYDGTERTITLKPKVENKKIGAQWGLWRVLISNMVKGVSEGFQKNLEIEGLGYKAEMKGKNLFISAGYSHPIMYVPPEGITFVTESATKIAVRGIDKQVVGQVAAEIRDIRPPEPYKGKGIRYRGEHIIRKAGKTGTK